MQVIMRMRFVLRPCRSTPALSATKALLASLLLLCTSSCAKVYHPVARSYPGSPLTAQEVAFVPADLDREIAFVGIDDEVRNPEDLSYDDASVLDLLPGTHHIVVHFDWTAYERVTRIARDLYRVEKKWVSFFADIDGDFQANRLYMVTPVVDPLAKTFAPQLLDLGDPSIVAEPAADSRDYSEPAVIIGDITKSKQLLDDRCRQCYEELHRIGSPHHGDSNRYQKCSALARNKFAIAVYNTLNLHRKLALQKR